MPFSWTPPFSPRLQQFDLSEFGEQQKQWLHEKFFLFIQTARTLKEWQLECWCLKAAFRAVRKTTQLCRKSRKGCLNILSDAEEYVAIIIIWCKKKTKKKQLYLPFTFNPLLYRLALDELCQRNGAQWLYQRSRQANWANSLCYSRSVAGKLLHLSETVS